MSHPADRAGAGDQHTGAASTEPDRRFEWRPRTYPLPLAGRVSSQRVVFTVRRLHDELLAPHQQCGELVIDRVDVLANILQGHGPSVP